MGKIRAIGVSNFQQADLDNLLDHASIKPMVNQILVHVGNKPFDLIDYGRRRGILVEAYSPVGHGKILDNAGIVAIAGKYGVSVPQLCIRYTLQLGLLPLPKTANPEHMHNNTDVNFEISDVDIEVLRNAEPVRDYGDASVFPVYRRKP